jgi:DNA-binding transcriptional regulator LsrR (DeoR family)
MGLRREEIAKKLGVSPYLVGQILASATSRGRR